MPSEDKEMTVARFMILLMMGLALLIGIVIGIVRDVLGGYSSGHGTHRFKW